MYEIRKHVSLSESTYHFQDFPQNVFYEFSGLSNEGLQKFKKTDKKSAQDFHIDWLDTKELIAWA